MCIFLRGEWECIVVLVIMLLKIFVFPRMVLAFNMSEMFYRLPFFSLVDMSTFEEL
jgi:hypothetical protein